MIEDVVTIFNFWQNVGFSKEYGFVKKIYTSKNEINIKIFFNFIITWLTLHLILLKLRVDIELFRKIFIIDSEISVSRKMCLKL